MVQFHVRAQVARTDVGLETNPTSVESPVHVCVHVVSEMLLELEVVVTDVAPMPGESIPKSGAALGAGATILLGGQMFGSEQVTYQRVLPRAARNGGWQ